MLITTLNKIREHEPNRHEWQRLLRNLGKTKADDEPLPFLRILESNGSEYAAWCLRTLPDTFENFITLKKLTLACAKIVVDRDSPAYEIVLNAENCFDSNDYECTKIREMYDTIPICSEYTFLAVCLVLAFNFEYIGMQFYKFLGSLYPFQLDKINKEIMEFFGYKMPSFKKGQKVIAYGEIATVTEVILGDHLCSQAHYEVTINSNPNKPHWRSVSESDLLIMNKHFPPHQF